MLLLKVLVAAHEKRKALIKEYKDGVPHGSKYLLLYVITQYPQYVKKSQYPMHYTLCAHYINT